MMTGLHDDFKTVMLETALQLVSEMNIEYDILSMKGKS